MAKHIATIIVLFLAIVSFAASFLHTQTIYNMHPSSNSRHNADDSTHLKTKQIMNWIALACCQSENQANCNCLHAQTKQPCFHFFPTATRQSQLNTI
eukprot:3933688-Rhodomonas_salina.2